MQAASISFWSKLPVSLRAILSGLLVALVAANVWPILLLSLSVPVAAVVEMVFLGLYLWWASGEVLRAGHVIRAERIPLRSIIEGAMVVGNHWRNFFRRSGARLNCFVVPFC